MTDRIGPAVLGILMLLGPAAAAAADLGWHKGDRLCFQTTQGPVVLVLDVVQRGEQTFTVEGRLVTGTLPLPASGGGRFRADGSVDLGLSAGHPAGLFFFLTARLTPPGFESGAGFAQSVQDPQPPPIALSYIQVECPEDP